YFAFPISIGWLWQLNERYAIAFALLAPLLLRPVRGVRGAVPLLLVAAAGLACAGVGVRHIRAFSNEAAGFDKLLDAMDPGRRVISLVWVRGSAWAKFNPYMHFHSYYRARKGGVASFSFAELPQSPLRYRPENAPPPHAAGWEWHPGSFRNLTDGEYYDYALVHGYVDPFARHQPGPQWRIVSRQGSWALYEKVP